tara:strand:+ start:393 stop:605 length:213 start_codon:yes stop_codon:yes gene_type:complete
MKNLTDELLLLITVIICFAAVVGMKVIYDNEQIKETQNFIYLNSDHKAYCNLAVEREASEAHLIEENCIR